ncbi:MAG: autotransporter assembly complex protein TamA [Steroidobacteraceae bacterium]
MSAAAGSAIGWASSEQNLDPVRWGLVISAATARNARSPAPRRRVLLTRAALMGLACAMIRLPVARAANPQPYKIDWAPSGQGAVDSLLKQSSQLQTLRSTAPVDPFGLIARARGDVGRLNTVLESFGYYQGSVTITINALGLASPKLADSITALPKGTDADVRIVPTLGPLYRIGQIRFQGALPPEIERQLGQPASPLGIATGDPAVASDVLAAGTNLQSALQNDGYAFARVDKPIAYEDPANHVLNLSYPVKVGARVRIGPIRIEGLHNVNESLVRRRLRIHTGDLYDAAALEKERQDLLTLGVFSTVSVHLGQSPDREGRIPITFVVREAKSHTVGVSAAYSSDLGASGGISWSDRNLLGGAQQLAFSANAINLGGTASTGPGYDATLSYSVPDFYHRDQTLRLSVEALRQELQAYSENGQLFGAIVSRKLSALWNVTGGVAVEHELIGQPGATCPPPAGTEPVSKGGITVCPFSEILTYELFMLPLTTGYDSTDLVSPLADPTHGYRLSLTLTPTFSYSHAGAVFLVTQGSATTYYDLHRLFPGVRVGRSVIAARVMAGLTEGATWHDLPPDQRFYAGGSGTVRGYRFQSVGDQYQLPDDTPSGIPTGGTSLQVIDLELRQRVGTNFGFVVFADGGGASQNPYPFSGTFRVGVGAGVRYYTSIGPIRFDIAVPTNRRANDDSFEVYIGLGQAF